MTPKKGKNFNRDPTVVYPDTSPQMMLAYRIFGPGHDELEKLEKVKKKLFRCGLPEDGEGELTPLGQDIEKSLKVNTTEILVAYARYQTEIGRMNKVDSIHYKRRRAQLGGAEGDGDGEHCDDYNDYVVEVDANGKIKGVDHVWAEGEDPYEQFHRDPALWLSRQEALARAQAIRASIAEVGGTLRDIQSFYNQRMAKSRELGQAVDRSVRNLESLAVYAEQLEDLITMHRDKTPGSSWKSRGRVNVTFGPHVPWAIHKVYDLEERLDEVRPALAACKRVQLGLAATKLLTTTQELSVELRAKLVHFAAMCFSQEWRDGFKQELEEERKQWEQAGLLKPQHTKAVRITLHKNAKALRKQ